MVFASLNFLYIFLPLNLILYYSWNNQTYRNWLLTMMSFVFYAWGEPIWIGLLLFSGDVDYVHGILIDKYRGTIYQKLPLLSCLFINLSLLASFKYATFIVDNVNLLTGLQFSVPTFSLPIGISFYTFQTISYVIDVYKGEVKSQKSFLKFMMFVSLYHQLVAGPIVRYAHIADEIDNRKLILTDISEGINRFCVGLFKKVCIANIAGELVSTYMGGNLDTLATTEAWFGICMFALQIYFDFSGYSDMAIGLGKMFGFHYHENFNYPYMATSAVDFWRRWHISLGTFFRDYVYIPLGGNRNFFYRNLVVVWFLTGLWHGASWNFICWGLFWCLLIIAERVFLGKLLEKLPNIFAHIYLLLAMLLGWVLFYFDKMANVQQYIRILFAFANNDLHHASLLTILANHIFWLILAILLCFPIFPFLYKKIYQLRPNLQYSIFYLEIVFGFILLLASTAMLVSNSFNPFLYFRF
jgi:alginate O-acetyltransferase complex protein AlgI